MRHHSSAPRTLVSLALVLALLGLSGCGESKNRDLLSEVKSSDKLVIGVTNEPPWSSVVDGEPTGIVPDILAAYLEEADIDAELEPIVMPFDSLIPALTSGRIQLIGTAMYSTPERAKVVTFSDTMFYNPSAMVVQEGNPLGIDEVADLCGRTGATFKGTVWVEQLEAAKDECPSDEPMEIKVYTSVFETMQDIKVGRVDGALIDSSISAHALNKNPDLGIELSAAYEDPEKASSTDAVATTHNNAEFFESFDPVYQRLLKDGTIEEIFAEYGMTPTEIWLSP